MRTSITLMILFLGSALCAQEIVFSQDVKSDTIRPVSGPNLKHFRHLYIAIGFPFATDDASDFIKPGVSTITDLGFRYKRRLNNTFALGFDLGFSWGDFRIKQGKGKSVPDSLENDKERIIVNSITPDVYFRLNVGRRGNFVGKYLDLGAYGAWNVRRAHETTNENELDEKVKVLTTRLNYVEKFSYGVLARAGNNRFALTARYRLSDLFSSESKLPELPRFSAGFEFGLFK